MLIPTTSKIHRRKNLPISRKLLRAIVLSNIFVREYLLFGEDFTFKQGTREVLTLEIKYLNSTELKIKVQ